LVVRALTGGRCTRPPRAKLVSVSVARYALGWLGAAAIAAVAAIVLLGDSGELPPVQQTGLQSAADAAGCELREAREPRLATVRHVRPAPAGVYERAPRPAELRRAIRRGAVVIEYRPDVGDEHDAELRTLQADIPRGTIVSPARGVDDYEISARAWRRELLCPEWSELSVDAVRLFRGRYLDWNRNGS
jgi:hypothetical protein